MSNNSNLNRAIKTKDDEFYTRYEDIEKEVSKYEASLEDKIIYCNCDNPEWSNFYKYFVDNFKRFKLKKIISTYKVFPNDIDDTLYKTEYDGFSENKIMIDGDGSYDSEASLKILKECDIVITNPPFSLLKKFMLTLIEYNKDFLIIGNLNAAKYKEIFPLIMENKLWLGYNNVNHFLKPDGSTKKFGNIVWFTTLPTKTRNDSIPLTECFNPINYPKYDNYDAINVDKVKNIPYDYDGIMGVPISFLQKYSPLQFEIVGEFNHGSDSGFDLAKPLVDGKELFPRIAIKKI